MSDALREPGLYRTTLPLEGKEEHVPGGRLIFYHPKSEQGPPIVLMPKQAVDNRWAFHDKGFLVQEPAWGSTLVKLPPQGFYTLKENLRIGNGVQLPEGLLIQLGYTLDGKGVAFPGRFAAGNRIEFEKRGVRITDLQLDALNPQPFKLVAPQHQAAADAAPNDEPTRH